MSARLRLAGAAGRCLLALSIVLPPCAVQAQSARAKRVDSAVVAAQVEQRTNVLRKSNGLSPVAGNPSLTEAAQRFAEFMAASDEYGHRADGREPAERARAQGYDYCMVAENIALQFSSLGFRTDELAAQLMDGWEKSPSHRSNMLLPHVVDLGVGIARSPRTQRYYAVQMFARPKSAAVHFEIANRSDAAVRYDMNGEDFDLPPRVTRTHEGCFDGVLKMRWPEGPPSPGFAPRDSARYIVVRDQSGMLRLQTN